MKTIITKTTSYLHQFINPNSYENLQNNRRASILSTVLWLFILWQSMRIVFNLISPNDVDINTNIFFRIPALLINCFVLFILLKGRLQQAISTFTIGFWLISTNLAIQYESNVEFPVVIDYVLYLFLIGTLGTNRQILLASGLTLVSNLLLGLYFSETSLTAQLVLQGFYIITILLVYHINQTLTELISTLEETNRRLQAEIEHSKETEETRRQSQQKLHDYVTDLSRLHRITTDLTTSFNEKVCEILDLCVRRLNLPLAIFTSIEGDVLQIEEILAKDYPLQPGDELELAQTYSAITLQEDKGADSEHIVAIEHMSNSCYATHPAHQENKAEAYVGTVVHVGGKIYGTITFSSPYPRPEPFSEADKEVIKLAAQWIGYKLERQLAQTQLEASLQEKEVLVHEIHHRVKNNLQVISSMLRLQTRRIQTNATNSVPINGVPVNGVPVNGVPVNNTTIDSTATGAVAGTVSEILRESQNRILSLALVHEQLYQTKDLATINFAKYIRTLVTELHLTYTQIAPRVRLHLELSELLLDIQSAISCGLIVSELVSNAFKYGFTNGQAGTLTIACGTRLADQAEFVESDQAAIAELSVSDDGSGIPEHIPFPNPDSLGLYLVSLFTKQLNGNVQLVRNQGTSFTITFPLERTQLE
ncbi:MAG: sensor histidine kinase [Chloroflexota bacterium]